MIEMHSLYCRFKKEWLTFPYGEKARLCSNFIINQYRQHRKIIVERSCVFCIYSEVKERN